MQATDNKGRSWTLLDSKIGPWPKDLREREVAYRAKNGEHWDGPLYSWCVLSPGDWRFEYLATFDSSFETAIQGSAGKRVWGGNWPFQDIYCPGGGAATDLYISATSFIVHFDMRDRTAAIIGQPTKKGTEDGWHSDAAVSVGQGTVDRISGRYYWGQGRYVEKLLPFKDSQTNEVLWLPAFLYDYSGMYRNVPSPKGNSIIPVTGQAPVFWVGSTKLNVQLFSLSRRGGRPVFTSDFQALYSTKRRSTVVGILHFDTLFTVNLTTKAQRSIPLSESQPVRAGSSINGPASHGGVCGGFDGNIYLVETTGAGGGPCRMFMFDPQTGKFTILYDSLFEGTPGTHIDGPADAQTLRSFSTKWQAQCPRTGAILNGGWDFSGVRRYQDGFVTSLYGSKFDGQGRPGWKGHPDLRHQNCNGALASDGSLIQADAHARPPRIWRAYRTDWPTSRPVNWYAETQMSKAKLEQLMLDYARNYVANYRPVTPPPCKRWPSTESPKPPDSPPGRQSSWMLKNAIRMSG
jgi:hypothetical protein